jgi:4-hydroxy-4-methyl-2-oxoglutarate aldolase
VGELLATQVKVREAAAMLVDASVRDVEELAGLGLPIWTRFVRARGATKTKVGKINTAVTVGGALISPGDVVVLDADGAVCVKGDRLTEVLKASEERMAREATLRKKLLAGGTTYDLHGLREIVERKK